jgi:hypothetical protein
MSSFIFTIALEESWKIFLKISSILIVNKGGHSQGGPTLIVNLSRVDRVSVRGDQGDQFFIKTMTPVPYYTNARWNEVICTWGFVLGGDIGWGV